MINVILLTSDRPRVGKSTFAYHLEDQLPTTKRMSFAEPIKEICYGLYESINANFRISPQYSLTDYKQTKKDVIMSDGIFNTSPRDQYCQGSLFISKLTSDTIWGDLAVSNSKLALEDGYTTLVFDDWRRVIESLPFIDDDSINLVKVFLIKDDVELHQGTAATESFEGQIKPEDCDIQFSFTPDWSNQEQLVALIKEKL